MFSGQLQNRPKQRQSPKCELSQQDHQKQLHNPLNETEKLFMERPNKLLPRAVLNPQQPDERAWRFLSNKKRKGLDTLEDIADEQTLQDLRFTLEQSGAFQVDDTENDDDRLTEEQRLQKWTQARKYRPDAAPFVPMKPLLGHQMAARALLRRTPQKRAGGRLERYSMDATGRFDRYGSDVQKAHPGYEADLTQFIILKRPKRKSQETEEARKGREGS